MAKNMERIAKGSFRTNCEHQLTSKIGRQASTLQALTSEGIGSTGSSGYHDSLVSLCYKSVEKVGDGRLRKGT